MVNITSDGSGNMVTYDADGQAIIFNKGDTAFILLCAALVMLMAPGVGYLYSGLLRRKNALSMLFLCLAVYCVVAIQWFFWGYSLVFSDNGSKYIGTLKHFGMMGVDVQDGGGIPAIVFSIYQSMFASVTAILVIGGFAERARLGPILVFVFMWTTIVYDPLAYWTWNPNGWAAQFGELDFAGGGPVHMSSGNAAMVISVFLGRREGYGTEKLAFRPHSISHIVLGTSLLFFGWFGFNGGSALGANARAAMACYVTNLAASIGGVTWLLIDYLYSNNWSAVSLCSGVIAGLIGITPAAGYVGGPGALAIGFLTAIAANYGTKFKRLFNWDEPVDVFATHGIGGFVGALLTGIFADHRIASFDGATEIAGGWINHNYRQLGVQLAVACAVTGYTIVMTTILLFITNYIPGCSLRTSPEGETLGIDEDQCGETSYDYVSLHRDIHLPQEYSYGIKTLAGTPATEASSTAEKNV